MVRGTKREVLWGLLIGALLLVLFFFTVTTVAYRDWSFICENTGSRKGYRQWCFGLKTGHWYQPTSVEMFITKESPATLQHRWTSYAGTGKNIFGGKLLHGHGRPGVILQVPPDCLNSLFDNLPTSEKKAFSDLLIQGDAKAILEKATAIVESQALKASANSQ